jgi:hypothetical protein
MICLYRRRINTTEMDALRRSARISKLDRKTNVYIGRKMDAQDMILDDITRKQLIWYGHVERMDPTRLPKMMIHWKPEGRKKRGRPRRTWKDGMYTAMNGRDLRMDEMEYESRKASSDHAIYTGCPRRNVPNFGRVFLMLNYTDITQNTCIQS